MAGLMILLDLEEQLLADRSGEQRIALLKRLESMQERLHAQRRLLSDRQRYLEIQSALQAVTAAIGILRTLFVKRVAPPLPAS